MPEATLAGATALAASMKLMLHLWLRPLSATLTLENGQQSSRVWLMRGLEDQDIS